MLINSDFINRKKQQLLYIFKKHQIHHILKKIPQHHLKTTFQPYQSHINVILKPYISHVSRKHQKCPHLQQLHIPKLLDRFYITKQCNFQPTKSISKPSQKVVHF